MRGMLKGFVVGTLGLAVLLGSSAVSLALPKLIAGKTYCMCGCYSKEGGNRDLGWEKVGACSLANGKACSFTFGGKKVSGKLQDCSQCTADAQGVCVYSSGRVYGPTGEFEVAPSPPPTVPPRKVTPQVAPGVQPPTTR